MSDTNLFDKRSFLLRVYAVTLAVILLYVTLYLFFPVSPYKLYIVLGLGVVLIIGIIVTLKTSTTRFSAHYYIVSCYILLCLNAVGTGGVGAPGSIWFLLCPLIGILTLSHRVAVAWLIISLITLASFYFFRDYIVVAEFQGGYQWYLIAYCLFFPTVYSFMRIFRIEVSKRSQAVNALNKLLEEKQHILEVSQKELIRQRDHLREQQLLLEEKQKQITALNESLEQKVSERTAALQKVNEQLLKFAFINAHNIRAPICRLLGLRNLLEMTSDPNEVMLISGYITSSIEELDDITKEASNLLSDTIG